MISLPPKIASEVATPTIPPETSYAVSRGAPAESATGDAAVRPTVGPAASPRDHCELCARDSIGVFDTNCEGCRERARRRLDREIDRIAWERLCKLANVRAPP